MFSRKLLTLGAIALASLAPSLYADVDPATVCASVTVISNPECQALARVYNAFHGDTEWSALEKTNWFTNTLPWNTISISGGHVTGVFLNLHSDTSVDLTADLFSGLSFVTTMHLDSNNIANIAPDTFSGLTSLNHLTLQGNSITEIVPGALSGLTNLTNLHLQSNQISSVSPIAFADTPNLLWLQLDFNNISTLLPDHFFYLSNLRYLRLGQNIISSVDPRAFNGLGNISEIALTSNLITSLDADIFSGLSTLEILGLSHNLLTSLDASIFSTNTNLYAIGLGSNNLTSLDSSIFSGLSNLQSLNLGNNSLISPPSGLFAGTSLYGLGLYDMGLTSLPADIFLDTPFLEELEIQNNDIKIILPGTFSHLANIYYLDITQNCLDTPALSDAGEIAFLNSPGFGNDIPNDQRDCTPPTAPVITTPVVSFTAATGASVTVSGTCETGATVSLTNSTMTAPTTRTALCTGGAYTFTISWPVAAQGSQTITLTQTDPAGNTSPSSTRTLSVVYYGGGGGSSGGGSDTSSPITDGTTTSGSSTGTTSSPTTPLDNGDNKDVPATTDGSSGTDYVDVSENNQCVNILKDISFDAATLTKTNTFMDFHAHLARLTIVTPRSTCEDADCAKYAPRQELIGIAARLRGIPLQKDYVCKKKHSDTEAVNGVADYTCQIAEKAQAAGLISQVKQDFSPLQPMTRAEAYSVLMKSVCAHPANTNQDNWVEKVAEQAINLGFTNRTKETFRPNRAILMQELYVVASRAAAWARENPNACQPLPEVVTMCQ